MTNSDEQSQRRFGTVVISLLSAAVGAVGGHALDFFTSRELKIREERAAAVERSWTETGDMYRQLFAMRPRLIGSILAYRQSVIDRDYARAKLALTNQQSAASLADYEKAVNAASQQVVNDRAQLELLLGWADL